MEDWDDCMSYATKLAEWRELANNITAGSIPESAISTQFLKGLPARYEAVVTAIDVRGETDMDTILPPKRRRRRCMPARLPRSSAGSSLVGSAGAVTAAGTATHPHPRRATAGATLADAKAGRATTAAK